MINSVMKRVNFLKIVNKSEVVLLLMKDLGKAVWSCPSHCIYKD